MNILQQNKLHLSYALRSHLSDQAELGRRFVISQINDKQVYAIITRPKSRTTSPIFIVKLAYNYKSSAPKASDFVTFKSDSLSVDSITDAIVNQLGEMQFAKLAIDVRKPHRQSKVAKLEASKKKTIKSKCKKLEAEAAFINTKFPKNAKERREAILERKLFNNPAMWKYKMDEND